MQGCTYVENAALTQFAAAIATGPAASIRSNIQAATRAALSCSPGPDPAGNLLPPASPPSLVHFLGFRSFGLRDDHLDFVSSQFSHHRPGRV